MVSFWDGPGLSCRGRVRCGFRSFCRVFGATGFEDCLSRNHWVMGYVLLVVVDDECFIAVFLVVEDYVAEASLFEE